MRTQWTKILICMSLATGLIGLPPAAHAADDTARFLGSWIATLPYNGQTISIVSIHDAGGFKNYLLLPNGALPFGAGTFSATDGKWATNAPAPNDSGTYQFANDNSVSCTNSTGSLLVWNRYNAPLPPVIAPSPAPAPAPAPAPPSAPDYQQEMAQYRKAAGAGDASAMDNIGELYLYGQGVPQDYQQAMVWFRKGADLGNAAAMCDIGYLYERGLGVPQDYAQAMTWYQKSSAAGSAIGTCNVGELYSAGSGVPRDYQQAMTWYKKAAAAGNATAMYDIGLLYENARGVPQDDVQAASWFSKAVAAGSTPAACELGYFYGVGRGVPLDYQRLHATRSRRRQRRQFHSHVQRRQDVLVRPRRPGRPNHRHPMVPKIRRSRRFRCSELVERNGELERTPPRS